MWNTTNLCHYCITVLLSYISRHESFLVDVFKNWQSHKGRFVSNWTIGSAAIASYCLQVECLHTVSLGEPTENRPRCLTFQETLVPTGSSYVSYQLPLKSKQRLSNSNQRRWTSPEQEPTKRGMALGYSAIQHYTCFNSLQSGWVLTVWMGNPTVFSQVCCAAYTRDDVLTVQNFLRSWVQNVIMKMIELIDLLAYK